MQGRHASLPCFTKRQAQLELAVERVTPRATLDMYRQTFFITFGGFDHHDELVNSITNDRWATEEASQLSHRSRVLESQASTKL